MTAGPEGECGRFRAILEARMAGDVPSGGDDERFLEEHEARCRDCALLARALERMAQVPQVGEAESSEVIRGALAARRRRRTMRAVRAASVAALAAAVLIVVLWPGTWHARGSGLGIEKGTLGVGAGERSAGSRVADGEQFSVAGGTAVLAAPGIRIALREGTRGRLSGTGGGRTSIRVDEGRIACRLDRGSAAEVEVEFPGGRARADGTLFAVTVDAAGTRVDVVAGKVRVGSSYVPPGRSLRIPGGIARDLAEEDREEIERLIEGGVRVASGDMQAAGSPAPRPGDEAPAVAVEETPAPRKAGAPHEVVLPAGPVPGIKELLDQARECRKARDWACAAQAYRKVLEEHPAEPEALVALVPLAEIELEHLGDAKAALGHYDLYLSESPDGPLAEEALFGKTRALGALGRTGDEAEALEKFLELHPQSVHSPAARERLEALAKGP